MPALGVPFERKVAPFRRGPCPSVVTLLGLPMALLLPCRSMIRKYLIPQESATPHTNAVFFASAYCPTPRARYHELLRTPYRRTSQNTYRATFREHFFYEVG